MIPNTTCCGWWTHRPRFLRMAVLSVLLALLTFTGYAQISGPDTVCIGDIVTYSTTATATSPTWSVTGGTIQSGQGSSAVTVQWSTAGNGNVQFAASGYATLVDVAVGDIPTPNIISSVDINCSSTDSSQQGEPGVDDNPDLQTPPDEQCITVCDSSTVIYSTQFVAGSSWVWNVQGAISTTTNGPGNAIEVTWGAPGIGFISVIETNVFGCVDSTELCIDIIPSPDACFTTSIPAVAGVVNICLGQTLYFTDCSSGDDLAGWEWDFGAGPGVFNDNENDPDPSFTYSSPGTYTVTLIVTNECGCGDTATVHVVVDNLPGPEIICPGIVCAGDTAEYCSPDGCGSNTWTITGGTPLGSVTDSCVTVIWGNGASGPGTVMLDIGGCAGLCPTPTVIQVPILGPLFDINGPDTVCMGELATYSVPKIPGTTYNWTLNNGSGGFIVDGQGTHQITVRWPQGDKFEEVISVDYCNDFLGCCGTGKLEVFGFLELIASGPTTACLGSKPEIQANKYNPFAFSAPADWGAILPDGTYLAPPALGAGQTNIFPAVNQTGTWIFIAKPVPGAGCCNDSSVWIVQVNPPPPPPSIIGDNPICPGNTYSYEAGPPTDPSYGYDWLINNGGSVTGSAGNPITVTWAAPTSGPAGPYQLNLRQFALTDPTCKSAYTTVNIDTFITPAITGIDTICPNGTTCFTADYGANPMPASANYQWSVVPSGYGSVTSGQGTPTACIEFTNVAGPQTAQIVLNIVDCNNAMTTFPIVITDVSPPTITGPDTVCSNEIVTLSAPGGYTTYAWSSDVAGPLASTSQNLILNPPVQAYYTVDVVDQYNCPSSASHFLRVLEAPNASLFAADGDVYCPDDGLPVLKFVAIDGSVAGDPYSFVWEVDGGVVGGAVEDTFCLATTGVPQTVEVVVTANGCADSAIIFVDTNCANGTCPTNATISCMALDMCNPVTLQGTTTGPVGTPTWSFGDFSANVPGTPGTSIVTHTYPGVGLYTVEYSVLGLHTNGVDSCLRKDVKQVEIPVDADFEVIQGCVGEPTCFSDLSQVIGGTAIIDWAWNFGEPTSGSNTATGQGPVCHTYNTPGTYTVTLVVEAPHTADFSAFPNCFDTAQIVVVIDPISANFSAVPNPQCENQPVQFTDLSTGALPIASWEWDFDDLTGSLNQNPIKSFTPDNTYNVELLVTDAAGCKDSLTLAVTITPEPTPGAITGNPTPTCWNQCAQLTAPAGASYVWSPNGETTATLTACESGTYSVQVTTADGCVYDTDPVQVIIPAAPTLLVDGPTEICQGDLLELIALDNASPGGTFQWQHNTTTTFGSYYPTFGGAPATLFDDGVYEVIFTQFGTGCMDTIIHNLVVHPLPPTPWINGPGGACADMPITLNVGNPDPNCTYVWSNGASGLSMTTAIAGDYTVTCYSPQGCAVTSFPFTINPLPDVECFITGCYCYPCGEVVTIPAPSVPGYTYQWLEVDPVTGVCTPIAGAINDTYTTTVSGIFKVAMETQFGCKDTTDVIEIKIGPCACEASTVSADPIATATGDSCCFKVTLENLFSDTYFTGIDITAIDGSTIAYSDCGLGWNVAGFSSTHVSLTPPGGFIPTGTIANVAEICVSNNPDTLVPLVITWYDTAFMAVCYDTLFLSCPLQPTCVELKDAAITCMDGMIAYTFSIQNHSDEVLESITLNFDSVVVTDPGIITFPPLQPDSCYGPITVMINPDTFTFGDTLCHTITAHNHPNPDSATFCCSDSLLYCVPIPDCPPCDSLRFFRKGNPLECCWEFGYGNISSFDFFEVTTEVITPGVTISSIATGIGSPWTPNMNAAQTSISWSYTGGTLPQNGVLPEICFNNDSTNSQLVVMTLTGINAQGDTVSCSDTLRVNCPSSCVGLFKTTVLCDTAGYHLSFNLYNNTGYTINQFDFFQPSPAGVTFDPSPVPTSMPDNTVSGFTVDLGGVAFGDTLYFRIRASDQLGNMDLLNCCVSDSLYCIPLPPCDTCTAMIGKSGPTTFCEGDSVTLCAEPCCDVAAATFAWFSGATPLGNAQCIDVTTSGTYCVEITCPDGTVEVLCESVTVIPAPALTVASPVGICEGDAPVQLVGLPAGGTWSGAFVTASGQFDPVAAGVGTAAATYTYTDPMTGCSGSQTIPVVVNALPFVDIVTQTVCNNDLPYSLFRTPSGGTFSAVPGLDPVTGGFDPSVPAPGQYGYTYTFTSPQGCTASDFDSIFVWPVPDCQIAVSPSDDPTWVGEPNTIYTNYASQCVDLQATGGAGFSYQWSTGATTQGITVCPTVTSSYAVTVTNSFGCRSICRVQVCVIEACPTNPNFVQMCFTPAGGGTPIDFCANPNSVPQLLNFAGVVLGPCNNPCSDQAQAPDPNLSMSPAEPLQPRMMVEAAQAGKEDFNLEEFLLGDVALDAYPNPFRNQSTISFVLPNADRVSLTVYDVTGKQVAQLFDGSAESGVPYRFVFDGSDRAAGMYHVRLVHSNGTITHRKLMLMER